MNPEHGFIHERKRVEFAIEFQVSSSFKSAGFCFHSGFISLITLSSSVSTYLPSFHSCLPKRLTQVGNGNISSKATQLALLQELLILIVEIKDDVGTPISLCTSSIVKLGVPSHDHFTAVAPFVGFVTISTCFDTRTRSRSPVQSDR